VATKSSLSRKEGSFSEAKGYGSKTARKATKKAGVQSSIYNEQGGLVVERVAAKFGMSKTQLAETVGLSRETLYKPDRTRGVKVQNRVREMVEIVDRVKEWAGGTDQAMAWYRSQPIPAFGGRTAESLVKDGKAADLRDYLDSIAVGGFA
jgi:hypothetical protein